jgi:hypothetical protein
MTGTIPTKKLIGLPPGSVHSHTARRAIMKVVNGGHDGPPATVAQMAAIEFPAAMEVARLPWASRTQSLFAMSTRAYQAAGVICELLLRGKAEIVSMVAEDPDRFDGLLEELATAADDCRTLLEVISSGEARLAIVLAAIEEGDDS